MNSTQILAALKAVRTSAECVPLQNACVARRTEIDKRIANIIPHPSPGYDPPEFAAAVMDGHVAMEALDGEIKALNVEQGHLYKLEQQCVFRHDELKLAEIRKAIPLAKKQLPGNLKRLDKTWGEFTAALEEFNGLMNSLGQYDSLPEGTLPLTDAELCEVLEMRERMWKPSIFRVLGCPNDPEKFPKSRVLIYHNSKPYTYSVRRWDDPISESLIVQE